MNHLLAFSRSGGGWTDRSSGPLDVGLRNVYAAVVFGYENDPRFQGEVVRAKWYSDQNVTSNPTTGKKMRF